MSIAIFHGSLMYYEMAKPLIALTMSTKVVEPEIGPTKGAYLNLPYISSVEAAGGIPVPVPNTPSGVELAVGCHGIIFTGGGDVDPSLYGEEPSGTDVSSIDVERDRTENAIIAHPRFSKIPALGICRGIQSLAAFQSGKLIQDIPSFRHVETGVKVIEHNQKGARSEFSHSIELVEGSLLEILFHKSSRMVNSMHHQALVSPPPHWRVSAYSEDGIIEAIELPGEIFKVGVQWHPEELYRREEMDSILFRTLVSESEAYSRHLARVDAITRD